MSLKDFKSMQKLRITQFFISILTFLVMGIGMAHAGIPVWTFDSVPGYSPKVIVLKRGSTIIKYKVTNQSKKKHTLAMQPLAGISQTDLCRLEPKGSLHSSCILTLTVTGSELPRSGISGGPVLCQVNSNGSPNPNECYRPNKANELNIIVVNTGYIVRPLSDGHEQINPATPQVVHFGSTQSFTVTADEGYTLSGIVDGTCPIGSWVGNQYTTGHITDDCTVGFNSAINQYTAASSGDGHEDITPSSSTVNYGSSASFTVIAHTGYTVSELVGGTCPKGSWSDNVYMTGAITGNCTVTFSSGIEQHTANGLGDGHESITPSSDTVNYGDTASFTVTANAGYTLNSTVNGTCPLGSWTGAVYTTGPITDDCTVNFSSTINQYTASASGDGNEHIAPSSRTVNYGSTTTFLVIANRGYTVDTTVGGTCPAGSWTGHRYTTGAITAGCTVSFGSTINQYTASASGDGNESITPSSDTVNYGDTASFTVSANAGYTLDTSVNGTCPVGSWSGSVYTTGIITSDCTISFSSTINQYTASASGDGNESITPSSDTVNYGDTASFTVIANTGYTRDSTVGGSCAVGSWTGNVYTTGIITSDCTISFSSTINQYTASASGDANESITPSSDTVNYGGTASFTVIANAGYTRDSAVGGTCSSGSWVGDVYTTGPITANCTVTFSAAQDNYMVTPSGDGHETINPNVPQTVAYGATQAFTVTADSGYTLSEIVSGSCPVGSWSGNVYTTGAITSNCSVQFSVTLNTYQVTPSGDSNESITPGTVQIVGYGATQAFTVVANPGYTRDTAVGGSCPAGSWVGDVYTTGAISVDCTVSFSSTINQYTASASGDGNESITPSSDTVNYGGTASFTVTANTGYTLSHSVGGTCPTGGGSWAGNVYTTGVITSNCTVSFSSTINQYTASSSGDGNESITPSSSTVNYGSTASFTVTANTGYTRDNAVGGSCPAGSWTGNVYKTGAITSNCTVSFSSTINQYTANASGDGNESITPSSDTVNYGNTASFTVTANAGYTLNTTVGGTCAAGSWTGNVYTTGVITSNCTVSFSSTINQYTANASGDGNESITPSSSTVDYGNKASFTVTANTGYTRDTAVGGTCPAGSWSGSVYTTGVITSNCTVSFSSTINQYTASASGDGNENITPSSDTVNYGSTASFTVTANAGYTLSHSVGGTCPTAGSSWVGDVYTTGVITSNCTVSFSAAISQYTASPSGDGNEDITPTSATVNYGGKASFTVIAHAGYALSHSVGGTCPTTGSSWVGDVYTTGAITSNCTVSFSAVLQTYTVGGSISNLNTSGLILQNNGSDDLALSSGATSFQFSTSVPYNGSYDVTVSQQPSGQTCSVTNGSGTVTGNVTSIVVTCAYPYVTNGPVYVTLLDTTNNLIYIGGNFTQVGTSTGFGVAVDINNQLSDAVYPSVNGPVFSVIPDGFGGWYIGGNFSQVGDVERNNLAHILHDGSLDLSWDPNVNGNVNVLKLNDNKLYVGGSFTRINEQDHLHFAALNTYTGEVTSRNHDVDGAVYALAVGDKTVYLGGNFTTISGQPRKNIAAVDLDTGRVSSWSPNADKTVNSLLLSDNIVYVGGDFTTIGGQDRNYIAAIDSDTGVATLWNPNADKAVKSLIRNGNMIYAGGEFSSIGGQTRNHIAEIDSNSGLATLWNPNADKAVKSLVLSDDMIYVGGDFTSIGGKTRNHVAVLDINTGAAHAWKLNANQSVEALAINGSTLYLGGKFNSLAAVTRNRIAALDASTGEVTSWNPGANGSVRSLSLDTANNQIYLGGDFNVVGTNSPVIYYATRIYTSGSSQSGLADPAWHPNPDQPVYAIVLTSSSVYLGGRFSRIQQSPAATRYGIAAVDRSNGAAQSWNPNLTAAQVYTIVVDDQVYFGGLFYPPGSLTPRYIGAVSLSGTFNSTWNPNADYIVRTLLKSGTTVYLGGDFENVGGQTRNYIAAVSTTGTGAVTAWNPDADDVVNALALSGTTIYAAGSFYNIGGQGRIGFAALDYTTGNATSWVANLNLTGIGYAIASNTSASTVYIGGSFTTVNSKPISNFAIVPMVP
jgi:hypothetical protein